MGCSGLKFFRWLCCIFVVFVNVISIILGALLAILGAILLWGYAVMQQVAGSYMSIANDGFKSAFGVDVDFMSYYRSMANITGSAAGVLIGFGVLLVIVSCIGCFGACCGNHTCLIIYKVCVGLLLIGQLIVVIIWFSNSEIFKRSVKNTLNTQVDKFTGEKNSNFETITLNLIQGFVGCCGVNNWMDFNRSTEWNRNYTVTDSSNRSYSFMLRFPVTCCKFNSSSFTLEDKYCPYNGTEASSNINVGCYNKVFNLVESYCHLDYFFYALAGLLGVELLLIIGALLIFFAKRKDNETKGESQYKMQPVV